MSDSLTVTLLRSQYDDLVARVETLTAERAKAHQWLVEHMADPDDDDDDFARLLERLFRFGDQGWGEAGRQTSRADAAEARVETLTAERDEANATSLRQAEHYKSLYAKKQAVAVLVETLEDALREIPDHDDAEIRSWLGSQDVIGSTTTVRIAAIVHGAMRARAALASRPAGEETQG